MNHKTTLVDLISAGLHESASRRQVGDDCGWIGRGELDRRSNRVAQALSARGVGADVLVGLCCERSVAMVVGLLGIVKAGGAYVPLDPDYPPERLSFMLEDAAVPVLLTEERLRPRLRAAGAEVLCLDSGGFASYPDTAPEVAIDPDSLAYVIYTSGSTGTPKGAMNSHRAIVNRLQWMQQTFGLTPADAVLQKTPFSFDVSVWEFFWPLMTGARLVLARPGGHQDPAYLAETIERHRITVLHFVPSMLRLFLEQPDLEQRCRSVRRVICSGEALSHELQQRFFQCLDAELHNLYGPTEAAVDVTHWPCRRDSSETVVPIGWPIANTRIHILDEQRQPVPPGVEGELYIGGVQVGRGYLNREALTAERFIADPFSDRPGARLYATGDLARWRDDGAIEYRGRRDHQVKIRGLRIELGEIEAALETLQGIQQAAVLVQQPQPDDQRLVACYVTDDAAPRSDAELRERLAKTLPAYMLPQHFMHLPALPLSPNGKLDRNALPPFTGTTTRKDAGSAGASADPVEKYLAEIWTGALGADGIGKRDRFFEIGGTSLLAARIVNRLQRDLGEFIYVVSMFDAPTIEEYAAFLKRDYAAAIEARLQITLPHAEAHGTAAAAERLSDTDIRSFEAAIPRIDLRDSNTHADDRNGRAMFVLAPPRSGTTLLRVMLSGHPELFAAPELQLLCFNTMAQRELAFTGKFGLWLEGLLRSIMEARQCELNEARRLVQQMVSQDTSTRECYRQLQEWIDPRILVDKSPSYALDPNVLRKAEEDFRSPLYIHLVRHPCGMITSFENYHIEQALWLKPHSWRGRQLGELVWHLSHRNIVDFLRTIPEQRQLLIRFEDLVAAPEREMQRLCDRFDLPYTRDLVEPYKNMDRKMVDGLYAESVPMGDTRLLERHTIDAAVADAWRKQMAPQSLSPSSWSLARTLGYALDAEDPPGSVRRKQRQQRVKAAEGRRHKRQQAKQS